MMELKQSTATQDLVFYMVATSDGYTPITGLSPTVTLSKNGGAFATPAGSVTEISGGFYKVAANATDSNTLGTLALKATGSGAIPVAMAYHVVVNLTVDAVAAANDALSATTTVGNNVVDLLADVADVPADVRTNLTTELARIDAAITTRSSHTAADVWTSTTRTLSSFGTLVADTAAAVWSAVTRTLTAASDTAGTTTLLDRLTSTRAGYLDKLNVTGTLAHSDAAATYRSDVSALSTSAEIAALSIPTAGAIADAVWDEPLAGHATAGTAGKALTDLDAGGAATPAEIADAVWNEALIDHAVAGSAGAGLAAASASGDPWATIVPGAYAAGTAGAGIGRLNQTPDGAVIVIPDPSDDAAQCVIYLNTRDFDGTAMPGVPITVTPIGGPVTTATGRLVGLDPQTMITDATGFAFMIVERTDLVIPNGGITYQVAAPRFKLNTTISPITPLFDLATIITP